MVADIVLIGFKGSGKTVIGRMLAKRMKKTFVDVDEVIEILYEQRTSQRHTVRSIFESKGEHYFRELEHEALVEVATGKEMVVSTGGGAVMDETHFVQCVLNEKVIQIYLLSSQAKLIPNQLK